MPKMQWRGGTLIRGEEVLTFGDVANFTLEEMDKFKIHLRDPVGEGMPHAPKPSPPVVDEDPNQEEEMD